MQSAEMYLGILHERGKRGLPLERVYRQLFNPELYLLAYGKIYRNQGAMTPGATQETVDGMNRARVQAIIEALQEERYRWTPARRLYIEKKNSTKKRPLGIPTWSDKLLQEIIRLILEAYYEPQFSDHSHGFRPHRGCHTALTEIRDKWSGTVWFIEGDISQCFDTLDHEVLMAILREKIHDVRFLGLLQGLLKAGYLEDWKYHATHSGTPQGGVVSPVLANIYLDRLDQFVERTLFPAYNRGGRKKDNREYQNLLQKAWRQRQKGQIEEARQFRTQAQTLPSHVVDDPDFRRLKYVRYADDFLLGLIGPRCEAEEIKQALGEFLQTSVKLKLSEEKTLITHARSAAASFLGYDIVTLQNNQKQEPGRHRRCINGRIGLKVPLVRVKEKCANYLGHNQPRRRTELLHDSEYTIVEQFQSEYRGVVAYYRLASNLRQFSRLRWVMEQSLTRTLASKLKISVPEVYDRFGAAIETDHGACKGLQIVVEREGKQPLVAQWGGISLKWQRNAVLNDQPSPIWNQRTELLERLLADACELCGATANVEVHHIRALKDLQKRGRAAKPEWIQKMAARQRKTLIVCRECHEAIHTGRLQRHRTANETLESRMQ